VWSKIMQDWISLKRSAGAPSKLVQSSELWVPTEAFTDAGFLVEVKYVSISGTHLYLRLETAPARDEGLFLPLQSPTSLDLAPLGGSAATQTAYAHATAGPPLASWLRWAIDSADSTTWSVCFRITMSMS
jgi:hypothetical protein